MLLLLLSSWRVVSIHFISKVDDDSLMVHHIPPLINLYILRTNFDDGQ
jgi:hypothetical protein